MQRTMNGRIASKANALSLSFTWALPRTQVMTFSVKKYIITYLFDTDTDRPWKVCFYLSNMFQTFVDVLVAI